MFSVLVRWAAVFCISTVVVPAWACWPAPDAKPKHEVVALDLPEQVSGVLVLFESEGYSLQAPAQALLTELSQTHMGVVSPNDLANALRSKMALGQNIDAQELVTELISNANASAPGAPGSEPRWTTRHANEKLQFAFAKLLQESKVSVIEISSERVLPQLELDRFSEICHGGRRFTSPEGKLILYVQDWIS